MSRTFVNVLGALGAGMVGFQKGQDMKARREREQRDDEYEQEQRARTRREQQRQDEIRTETAAAYAPTSVESGEVYQPQVDDDGNAMPANPTAGTYKAGGRRYTSMTEATQAADAYNTPAARTTRMADVLGAKGEAKAAADLRTSARQERAGELQLADAERAHLDRLFEQSLSAVGTPDQLAELVSKSTLGGQLQIKAVPSPDGKTFSFVKVNPDGSASPASDAFPNTPEGLLQAKVGMSRAIPLAQKLEHVFKNRDMALKERQVAADEEYKKAMAEAATTRADKAGGTKSTFDRMDEVDKIQFNALNKTAQQIEEAIIKAQADGMWQPDSPNAKALTSRLAAVRLQAVALVKKYSDGKTPDPIGLRAPEGAPGPAPAATTRPMTTMEKVMADMKATGVTEADVRDNGQTVRITMPGAKPAAPAAAPAAPPAAAAAVKPAQAAFTPDPVMEERLQRETAEMNAAKGTRYAYSNEVTAYLKKKREAEATALQARGVQDREEELRRAKERAKAYGI
jgi:hypothetical protein